MLSYLRSLPSVFDKASALAFFVFILSIYSFFLPPMFSLYPCLYVSSHVLTCHCHVYTFLSLSVLIYTVHSTKEPAPLELFLAFLFVVCMCICRCRKRERIYVCVWEGDLEAVRWWLWKYARSQSCYSLCWWCR